jgi:hypothetical protein
MGEEFACIRGGNEGFVNRSPALAGSRFNV